MHVKVFAFDPDLRGAGDLVKDNTATVGWGDCDGDVIWGCTWACLRFKFAVKEFVEARIVRVNEGGEVRFKFFDGQEDFVHVELVEVDESFDFSSGKGVIVFAALFHTQRSKQLFGYNQ